MIIRGVDTLNVPDQFDTRVPGRTLILDGDFPAYKAASTVKTLPTALRRFVTEVMTLVFLTGAEHVNIHLTAKGSAKAHRARLPTAKPYQGNRANKPKPPLLEPLREAIEFQVNTGEGVLPPEWSVTLHRYWEADDGMIMDAVRYGDRGIIVSEDKDLRLTPGPFYETSTGLTDIIPDRFGWIDEKYTDGGTRKVTGHGTKFFWAQMLMGDTADNVKGIEKLNGKLSGAAAAYNYLDSITDENEAANRILWEYAKINQMALPEAECLWLRRSDDDSAYRYFQELDLDKPLRSWLDQQHEYCQYFIEQENDPSGID